MSDRLTMWVLYDSPLDFPGQFVIRGQDVLFTKDSTTNGKIVPHKDAMVGANRDLLEHEFLVQHGGGLTWIGRDPGDEPQIVGVWL